MSNPIRIVGAVADTDAVTMYKEDGNTIIIKQGDPRLADLLEKIIPITSRNEVAVIELDTFSVYADFEKKTSGFARFFKVAKNKIKDLLSGESTAEYIDLPPMPDQPNVEATQASPVVATEKPSTSMYANTTTYVEPEEEPSQQVSKQLEKVNAKIAAKKISERAKPVEPTGKTHLQSMNSSDDHATDETIVAVIGDTIIPNIEMIKPYIAHALNTNSTIGVENFLKRVASVIGKRSHSIQDLMRFMQRGDLPIADDGCIIAYKKLYKKTSDALGDHYVDAHTQKVTQKIGSYVCVDEKLVDPNRNNECSNGLHIGQRGYMGAFNGDRIVLVKLAPEDVITVPERDASKIRAMGYHILGELPTGSMSRVNANTAMTGDVDGKSLLARAIKGDHVARLEEVRIHGQSGNNVVITSLVGNTPIKNNETKLSDSDNKKANVIPIEGETVTADAISPKAINKAVIKATAPESKSQRNARLKRERRAAKRVADAEVMKPKTETVINNPTPEGEKVIKKALEQAPKKKAVKPKPEPKKEIPKPIPAQEAPMSNKQLALAFYASMCDGAKQVSIRKQAARDLQGVKKKAKISYEKLGLLVDTQLVIDTILDPKWNGENPIKKNKKK